MPPFRFGVITSSAPDAVAWREQARQAESLGYSTLLMPDHFQDQWAPLVGLATAAAVTERLNVGTLVFDNDYRHPVVLAKEIASLDLATGGRVEFGLGAGWKRTDYDEAGIAYDRPGVRIARMAEALAVMRALWSSREPVHFKGEHYTITGAVGTPRPHTAGGPKVCIGGGGRRILTTAAQQADIVAVNATLTSGALGPEVATTSTPAAFDEKVAWVRDAAGERADAIELQCHCAFTMVTEDRDSVLAPLAKAFGVSADAAVDIPLGLIGTVDQLCETLVRRRDRWGFSYWIVPDSAMQAFAPVVDQMQGQ